MCTVKGLTLKAEIMDESSIARAVTRISFEIIERNKGTDGLCLIGLFSRGAVLAKRIGFDPAVMASPFITTIVDALSLLVYFNIARLLLHL